MIKKIFVSFTLSMLVMSAFAFSAPKVVAAQSSLYEVAKMQSPAGASNNTIYNLVKVLAHKWGINIPEMGINSGTRDHRTLSQAFLKLILGGTASAQTAPAVNIVATDQNSNILTTGATLTTADNITFNHSAFWDGTNLLASLSCSLFDPNNFSGPLPGCPTVNSTALGAQQLSGSKAYSLASAIPGTCNIFTATATDMNNVQSTAQFNFCVTSSTPSITNQPVAFPPTPAASPAPVVTQGPPLTYDYGTVTLSNPNITVSGTVNGLNSSFIYNFSITQNGNLLSPSSIGNLTGVTSHSFSQAITLVPGPNSIVETIQCAVAPQAGCTGFFQVIKLINYQPATTVSDVVRPSIMQDLIVGGEVVRGGCTQLPGIHQGEYISQTCNYSITSSGRDDTISGTVADSVALSSFSVTSVPDMGFVPDVRFACPLSGTGTTSYAFVLPVAFSPGATTITETATDCAGNSTTFTKNIEYIAIPPVTGTWNPLSGSTISYNDSVSFTSSGEITGNSASNDPMLGVVQYFPAGGNAFLGSAVASQISFAFSQPRVEECFSRTCQIGTITRIDTASTGFFLSETTGETIPYSDPNAVNLNLVAGVRVVADVVLVDGVVTATNLRVISAPGAPTLTLTIDGARPIVYTSAFNICVDPAGSFTALADGNQQFGFFNNVCVTWDGVSSFATATSILPTLNSQFSSTLTFGAAPLTEGTDYSVARVREGYVEFVPVSVWPVGTLCLTADVATSGGPGPLPVPLSATAGLAQIIPIDPNPVPVGGSPCGDGGIINPPCDPLDRTCVPGGIRLPVFNPATNASAAVLAQINPCDPLPGQPCVPGGDGSRGNFSAFYHILDTVAPTAVNDQPTPQTVTSPRFNISGTITDADPSSGLGSTFNVSVTGPAGQTQAYTGTIGAGREGQVFSAQVVLFEGRNTITETFCDKAGNCSTVTKIITLVTDTDGDGVLDPDDQCVRVPGTAAFKGCPAGLRVSVQEVDALNKGPALQTDTALETKVFSSASGSCVAAIGNQIKNYNLIYSTCIAENTQLETFSPSGSNNKPRNLDSDLVGVGVTTGDKLVLVRSRVNPNGSHGYMGFNLPNMLAGQSRDVGFNDPLNGKNTFVQTSQFSRNSQGIWNGSNRAQVIQGSELYVYTPDHITWSDGEEIYPFTFISDSDWTLDVCLQVPAGYQVVAPGTCDQALISNEAKVVEFTVASMASSAAAVLLSQAGTPEPNFTFTLNTKHTEAGSTVVQETNNSYQVSGSSAASKRASDLVLAPVIAQEKAKALVIAQAEQAAQGQGVSAIATTFKLTLAPGTQSADVLRLQQYLNSKGFLVASTGNGSRGQETNYFGPRTREALRRFQEAHRAEILAPIRLQYGTGVFGERTRAFINANQ